MSTTIIPQTGEILVDAQGISLSFGDTVVIRDLGATVYDRYQIDGPPRGEVIALLAPSGMGKTQTFRIFSGQQKPTSGIVKIGVDGITPKPSEVGVVAQHYPLYDHRTVYGNLMQALRKSKLSKPEREEAVVKMLEVMGMTEWANYYPGELSGGQQQRIAIAQQLLCSKQVILMDEPFSGLDPLKTTKVINLVIDVANQDEHNTIIVVTHNVNAAVAVADQIWLMGRDHDASGEIIPGARIQRIYDLIPDGLAWIDGDVRDQPGFFEKVREIEEEFKNL